MATDNHKELMQQISQLQWDIRIQIRKQAYWNAAKLAHDLYELLNKQPYVEENNPPVTPPKGEGN